MVSFIPMVLDEVFVYFTVSCIELRICNIDSLGRREIADFNQSEKLAERRGFFLSHPKVILSVHSIG